jgi:hypothetical protein
MNESFKIKAQEVYVETPDIEAQKEKAVMNVEHSTSNRYLGIAP